MTTATAPPTFGILTAPQQVTYDDLLTVWQEMDATPEIRDAWLFDHLLPIAGDPAGPIFEGWTMLAALAAQTQRVRLGLMVTSNRFRPPAMLAKIATTVDVVSGGRLEFGIGAGSRPILPEARREYDAHGLPYDDAGDAVASLDEACAIVRRLWTEPEPFDFCGVHHHLAGAFANPKPVQRPGPPIMIGGRSTPTLRIVARHADRWNFPGDDLDAAVAVNERLDRCCADIGRDPASIERSLVTFVAYDDAAATRDVVSAATGAGFAHVVLILPPPYPDGVVRWVRDELIGPTT